MDNTIVPDGEYQAQVLDVIIRDRKTGPGQLASVKWQVVGGDFNGTIVWGLVASFRLRTLKVSGGRFALRCVQLHFPITPYWTLRRPLPTLKYGKLTGSWETSKSGK